MTRADLAESLRRQGDLVTLGGLAGLLALAGLRVESVRAERGGRWTALVVLTDSPPPDHYWTAAASGTGTTISLALAAACEDPALGVPVPLGGGR